MGSQAVDILSKMDLWTVLMVVFGVIFLIQQLANASKSMGEIFGVEKKEEIEKREIKESIHNLSEELNKSIGSLCNRIDELKQENALFKEELQRQHDLLKIDVDNITTATREELCDKINAKFKRYFEIGYIPADEFDEFAKLHNAYKLVGGNHTGDLKYNKCVSSLEVRDDSTQETSIM